MPRSFFRKINSEQIEADMRARWARPSNHVYQHVYRNMKSLTVGGSFVCPRESRDIVERLAKRWELRIEIKLTGEKIGVTRLSKLKK